MSTNRALAISISADSANYQQELRAALAQTERFAAGVRKELGGAAKNSQASFQNLGYQINDVAAQVSAGGNVIQAAGMQVGQFLQAFGPWGAIVGAAIAVGGAFAASMWDTEDAAKAAQKANEDYAQDLEYARSLHETAEQTQRRLTAAKRDDITTTRRAAVVTLQEAQATLDAAIIKAQARKKEAEGVELPGFGKNALASRGLDQYKSHTDQELKYLEEQRAKLQVQIDKNQEVINLIDTAPETRPGSGGRTKEDRDDLAAYIATLKQAVELERLDGEQKAVKAALYRAEAAAAADKRTLTAAQIAEVSALAAEEFNLAEAKKKNKDELAEYLAALQQELELEKLEGREKAIRTALIKAQSIAMKENTVLTDEQVAAVTRLAGASYDVAEQRRQQAKALKADVKADNDMARQLGMTFQSAFEDAIVKGEGLRGVLKGIGDDIARMITRQAVVNPLINAVTPFINSAVTGAGNWITNAVKTDNHAILSHLDGVRASGGPVNAGGTYLVGEHGPEIVKMGAPGSVTPTNRLAFGGDSGPAINVEQHLHITTGVAQTVRAEVANMLPQITAATKAAISNDQARKGRSL